MTALDHLLNDGNWDITPQRMDGHDLGYSEITYVGDYVVPEARIELRELRDAFEAVATQFHYLQKERSPIRPYSTTHWHTGDFYDCKAPACKRARNLLHMDSPAPSTGEKETE